MSLSVKMTVNIYLYLKINALLICIKVRIEKFNIVAYLSALVQLNNVRDQKPLKILKPSINRNHSFLYSPKILHGCVFVLQNYQIFKCYLCIP